jgi:hypothetical protein
MKKIAFMMVCLMAMLFVSNNTYAQEKKNPFIGSWLATASTPMGESEMTIVFEEKDGKITGYMTAEAMGDEKIECENIDTEKADEISFSFYAAMAGMNIDMYLTLDGDDACKGAMMGQFPVEAKRK